MFDILFIHFWNNARLATIQQSQSAPARRGTDRKSTRLNSSHMSISYAVFCLKKKKKKKSQKKKKKKKKTKNKNKKYFKKNNQIDVIQKTNESQRLSVISRKIRYCITHN